MGRQWAQSKPLEYQQNQREGGKLETHLHKLFKNVIKCIYVGVYIEKKQKNKKKNPKKDTVYDQSQKNLRFT